MEITFEEEFMGGGSGGRLSQQQREEFYKKMKQVAVQICVVDQDYVGDDRTFWIRDSDRGSGFLVSKEGHILTNSHVVRGHHLPKIVFIRDEPDSTSTVKATGEEAIVMYDDPTSDVAILKVKHPVHEYNYAKLGKEEDIFVGMEVFSISHPKDFNFSFLIGYVACPHRIFGDCFNVEKGPTSGEEASLPLIQIKNLHLNSGASGGPLFDSKGRVIGMNTSTSDVDDYDFAVHIQKLSQIWLTHLTTSSSSVSAC